ncbi:MAG: hypothetical protein ACKO1L_11740 [Brachymonas sp.]
MTQLQSKVAMSEQVFNAPKSATLSLGLSADASLGIIGEGSTLSTSQAKDLQIALTAIQDLERLLKSLDWQQPYEPAVMPRLQFKPRV